MAVRKITGAEFRELVCDYTSGAWKFNGARPAVVDFFAVWCGPCRMLSPTLEKLSEEFAGKVDFYKVDTDGEPELSAAFGIQAIPSLLLCGTAAEPQMTQGLLPESSLRSIIEGLK